MRIRPRVVQLIVGFTAIATMLGGCADGVANPSRAIVAGDALATKGGDPNGNVGRSLSIQTAAAGAMPGVAFSIQPVVEFHSSNGALLPVGEVVTAKLLGDAGTLSGNASVRALGGVASFANLAIDRIGSYTLEFSAPGANPVRAELVVAPPNVCQYSVTAIDAGPGWSGTGATVSVGAAGGTASFSVTATPSTCTWTPVSDVSWIVVADGSEHTGNGVVTFTVGSLAHSSPVRSGRINLWNPYPLHDTNVGLAVSQVH